MVRRFLVAVAVGALIGAAWIGLLWVVPRLPERRWFFHRQKYVNDIRCAPARHVRLVTVPAGSTP